MADHAESILEFTFNYNHYSFASTGMQDSPLREILQELKKPLNLAESVKLKARLEPASPFLDESLKLSEVLGSIELAGTNYLEVCIDNLNQLSSDTPTAVRAAKNIVLARREPDGQLNFDINTSFSRDVYHWEDKYVVIPALMLKQFRDHLKNDFMARWINRLCGTVLGAGLTIFVTLQNSDISDLFRSSLVTALFFCVFCVIAFGLIEALGRPKDRRSFETLIDSLLKGEEHRERSKSRVS